MVCAIIGIMTMAALISMRGNQNERAVETAAREVTAAIRQAQNYALTGKNAGSCTGYNFSCTKGSANYGIGGCVTINYTLKNGVQFKNAGSDCGPLIFSFALPHATVSMGGSTTKKIILEDRNGGNSYTICVYDQGSIKELPGLINPCPPI